MVKPGEGVHPMFSDEVTNRGFHPCISTSNLSMSGRTLAGFGPTAPDGKIC